MRKDKAIEEELKKYGTYTIAYKDEDDWVVEQHRCSSQ